MKSYPIRLKGTAAAVLLSAMMISACGSSVDNPADGGPSDGGPSEGVASDGGPSEGVSLDGGPSEGVSLDGGPSEGGSLDGGLLDGGPSNGADGAQVGSVWQDPSSGLLWQVLPEYPEMAWAAAVQHCDQLVHGGIADWRMPTIDELRSLIRGCSNTMTGGACGETNACNGAGPTCYDGNLCMGCQTGRGPGEAGCYWPTEMGSACGWSWSATGTDDMPGYACFAHFGEAHLSHDDEARAMGHHVLCVH